MIELAGHDRKYTVPERFSDVLTRTHVTAWDLLQVANTEGDVAAWADGLLATLLQRAEASNTEALDCADCDDLTYFGVPSPNDPDLLTGLVREGPDGTYERLTASGWQDYTPPVDMPVEALIPEAAAELASVIASGGTGLVLRFAVPVAWLPPSNDQLIVPITAAVEQADAKWKTYAIVDDLDAGAVLNLVRLASGPKLEDYVAGTGWTEAEEILNDLQGITPPKLVELDEALLASVIEQIDAGVNPDKDHYPEPVTAAVSPDPRAEKLRRYWSVGGKGGLKIRWGVPGDFRKCVRYLRKHLGPRAKGYCANLHKRNTGMWPGSRNNRGLRGAAAAVGSPVLLQNAGVTVPGPRGCVPHIFSVGEVVELVSAQIVASGRGSDVRRSFGHYEVVGVDASSVYARITSWTGSVPVVASVVKFLAAEKWSEHFGPHRTMPERTGEAHWGPRVTIGPKRPGPRPASFDTGGHVVAAQRSNWLWALGASGLLDSPVMLLAETDLEPSGDTFVIINKTSHAAYCTHPSCQVQSTWPKITPEAALAAAIKSGTWFTAGKETDMKDGIYSEIVEDDQEMIAAITAGAFPLNPPEEWFDDPQLEGPTPLTIEASGRVFGHIASFDVAHIGLPGKVHAPRSKSGYAFFHTGEVVTASGSKVSVGQLTLAGGHAPMNADAGQAVAHYDNTASAVVDIHVGEDKYGIWAAGAARPEVTPEQVRALRASAPSGDWRPINGQLELVAVCQVNVPGFPIARARVASGAVMALVAAGASVLAEQRYAEHANRALADKVAGLEAALIASGVLVDTAAALAEAEVEAVEEAPAEVEPEVEAPEPTRVEALRKELADKRRAALRDRVRRPESVAASASE